VKIIEGVSALTPRPTLSLTTNGIGLVRLAGALADAGLDRVNVSLDTLREDRFEQLARRRRLSDVLDGLVGAEQAGLRPVKLNAVLMRGINDDEATDLLRFALEHGYELRFIEQMPLDAQHAWRREHMVAGEEILAQLRSAFTLLPDPHARGAAPAETWVVDGHVGLDGQPARVGVIASVTQPFCGDCTRVRLSADGQLFTCLFATTGHDVRGLLRGGVDDGHLADALRAIWAGRDDRYSELRSLETVDLPKVEMSYIGG
jgi:GTP 3',8-cyclase